MYLQATTTYGSLIPGSEYIRSLVRQGTISPEAAKKLRWMDHYAKNRNAMLTCRYFGISPKTFYRWKNRFDPYDLTTLEEESRRPQHVRQSQTPTAVVDKILELRTRYPRWGKKKLVVLLKREGIKVSASTVGRVMNKLKVSTLAEANRFLEAYLPRFNAQFEREPREPQDLHRPLPKGLKFEEIFCLKTVRMILDGYIIRWKGRRFAIEEPTRRMLGRPATVMLHFDGRLIIRYEGRDLGYREIAERPKLIPVVPVVRPKPPKYIPPPTHPWKVYRDRFAGELPERP